MLEITQIPRNIIRCTDCKLVQYETSNGLCRKCGVPLPHPAPLRDKPDESAPRMYVKRRSLQGESYKPAAGHFVRDYRRRLGMSQEDAAKMIGVNRTYLTRIEGGHLDPGTDMMIRMCRAFHIPLLDLFTPLDSLHTLSLFQTLPLEDQEVVMIHIRGILGKV